MTIPALRPFDKLRTGRLSTNGILARLRRLGGIVYKHTLCAANSVMSGKERKSRLPLAARNDRAGWMEELRKDRKVTLQGCASSRRASRGIPPRARRAP